MIPVRQSTAFETAIGPVLDADGVAVTGGVVANLKIKKTTGNFAALNGSATLTHVSAGVYDLVLTTSDTDTVGTCVIAMDDTTNACAPLYLQVMEEAVYDALYAASANAWSGAAGSSIGVANVTQLGGVAQSLTDLKDFADDGYDPSTNKVQGVVLVDTLTTYTGNTPQTADHTANIAAILTDTGTTLQAELDGIQADTEDIQSRIPAALTAGGNMKADALAFSGSTTAADNAEVVFDTDFADSYDTTINHWKVDVLAWRGTNLSGPSYTSVTYGTIPTVNVGAVSGDDAAANTLEVFAEALDQTTGQIDSGTFAAGAIAAATFAADVDAEILSYIVDDATRIDASSLNTATVTTIPAIVADTNELQTDWANGGRLDLILDATATASALASLVTTVGVAGAGLTEAGGTGDHLTVLATAAALTTVDTVVDSILVDTTQIKADLPSRPTRGVALADLMFMMVDATDLNTPETGVTVTATISKDGGAFAACANAVSEVSGGWYKITLSSGEMTADSVAVKMTGTGCAQRNIAIRTQAT